MLARFLEFPNIPKAKLAGNHNLFLMRKSFFFTAPKESQSKFRMLKASITKCSEEDKFVFFKSHCLVPLSLGQPVHEKEFLEATVKLLNLFRACTFVLGDTLQRHTMKLTMPETEENLVLQAKKRGDLWLLDNINTLAQCNIPWEITRWDMWRKNKNFEQYYQEIKGKYETNGKFREAFEKNIDEYLNRLKRNNKPIIVDEKLARKLCLDYLIEECTVMFFWTEKKYEFELYANGRAPAMQATYDEIIKPCFPDLLKPISLRFKKVSSIIETVKNKQSIGIANGSRDTV